MLTISGTDPGKKGGVCVIDTGSHTVGFYQVELKRNARDTKNAIDLVKLTNFLKPWGEINEAWVEEVNADPRWGKTSCFSFGESYGQVQGVFAGRGADVRAIRPQAWKGELHVPADKALAVAMTERLFPCARDAGIFHGPRGGLIDGPAEAGLIALYGVLHNGIKLTKPLTLV